MDACTSQGETSIPQLHHSKELDSISNIDQVRRDFTPTDDWFTDGTKSSQSTGAGIYGPNPEQRIGYH